MIEKDTARDIALAEIQLMVPTEGDDHFVILDSNTIEREYGWVFFWELIESGEEDYDEYFIGDEGPFLVLRESGKTLRLGSAYPAEWYLSRYEDGFRPASGKLTISRVYDMDKTFFFLIFSPVYYNALPVSVAGHDFSIPQQLNPEQIKQALNNLPAVFEYGYLPSEYGRFLEMDASKCCDYRLDPDA